MNKTAGKAKIALLTSMVIFGTIGLMRRTVELPSGVLACFRGLIGAACLLPSALRRLDRKNISGRDIVWLCLGGAALGFNWILLFEAYRYTTVAVATICYYMAPVLMMTAAPLLLRERLTVFRIVCVGIALVGMIPVTGVLGGTLPDAAGWKGILLGLGAAVLYAAMMLINKKVSSVEALPRTALELAVAAVVLVPYGFLAGEWQAVRLSTGSVFGLLVMGVVHTGIAYALYFGALPHLPAQTVALYSYLDPVLAVILSALVLPDAPLTVLGWIGAALVLLSTALGERPLSRRKKP